YATQNRQTAVKELARQSARVLVIGSPTSSNANRLVEVARNAGTPAQLIEDAADIDTAWLGAAAAVGLTAGASTPESLVERAIARCPPQSSTSRSRCRASCATARCLPPERGQRAVTHRRRRRRDRGGCGQPAVAR